MCARSRRAIQIRCRANWVPGGSITHTEGVLYSVLQGCQFSARLITKITNNNTLDQQVVGMTIPLRFVQGHINLQSQSNTAVSS